MKTILCFVACATSSFCLLDSSAFPDEKGALAAIEKLGGAVRGVALDTDALEIDFHLQGDGLTDEGLDHLAGLQKVVNLHLGETQVTDAGMAQLKGLSSLRRLHLEKTAVGDAGLAHLKGLANLEYLNLYATKVTDKGVEHLKGLKKLRRLYLWQSKVTDAGVARLKKALPNLVINTGADLSALPPPKPPKKLSNLKWIPATTATPPKSRSGPNLTLHFENKSKKRIKLYWVSYGGDNQLYGVIEPGKTRRQNTYTANTWLVCDDQDHPLGYFISEKDDANAVIPSGI
ncbi:MAG: hypothetical protein VB997_10110 [Opitutales bacterium]